MTDFNKHIDALRGRPLGRILVKMNLLTAEQVQQGLEQQRHQTGPLGEILVELELIDDNAKNQALAHQAGMEFVDLERLDIPREVIHALDAQMVKSYNVIPIDYDEESNHLTIAMDSPSNFRATDDLQTLMGFVVTAKVASPEQILSAIEKHYSTEDSLADLFNEASNDDALMLSDHDELVDLDALRDVADSNPVKRLVNMVLLEAIRAHASDIHFEPFEDEFRMRYRIDGLLYDMIPPPKPLAVAIASRIKVMANLNIAERRLPQDGRIELIIDSAPVDLRISVLPTMFGESVVMRVLDRSNI